VNNWSNGWRLRPEQNGTSATQGAKVNIIFWPQYLEFLGFGLMIVSLIFVLLHQPKIKVDEKNN